MKFFSKLQESLSKSSRKLGALFASFTGADDDFYDQLEETLVLADVGALMSASIVDDLREVVLSEGIRGADEIKAALSKILAEKLSMSDNKLKLGTRPSVILVVGVNGVGKTTTIGKLAYRYVREGKKVLMCAGDTFRAAAGEQLSIWAERSGADIIRRDEGADPASVMYDGINAAKSRGVDVIICDTAGRLHNKSNLMNELSKIHRIIDRELPEADKETLLVLDSTTGQNGLIQAREFKDSANITGIALTKLDGTAKGGIVFAITGELLVPVKLIGIGEGVEDLLDFDAAEFASAILA
ncbi:MAG: signal recognition particle-docking protein FtsY [Oscillospiraceae bacterium]|nr:signal recognition particle-docking protein FtsY [Oscillospiraceae bacterium]MCL2279385.1 signal recognition particle-docking protein FtsY [Oscillospiraceae bacterium]